MDITTAPDLRNLSDDELAALFSEVEDIDALVAECDRRDRADRKARRERDRRAAIRSEWEMYQHADYLMADAICRGNLLSKAGIAAGVSEYSLWTGREAVARKYASEELNEHWDANPRMTATSGLIGEACRSLRSSRSTSVVAAGERCASATRRL